MATIKLDIFGEIVVTLGTVPQGQGHETTASQVARRHPRRLARPDPRAARATTRTGTRTPASPGRTRASSRSPGSEAVKGATEKLALEIRRLAGGVLGGADPDDIVLEGGFAKRADNPEAALPFMACGAIVNANNAVLPPELRDVTLNCRYVYVPPFEMPDFETKFGNLTLTYATQIHACVVEIDPRPGDVEIVDYAAVDDCGIRIHPQIVEGQVHGATAHAIGAALHETFAYDEDGQLLTANFYDYHVPHALDLPEIKTGHIESPVAVLLARDEGAWARAAAPAIHAICAAIQDALRRAGQACDRERLVQPARAGLADDPDPGGDGGAGGGDDTVKVEGTKEFDAPAQLVWDVLNDPSKMAKLLPGVESFEIQDDRHWTAAVKIPLGMGGLKLNFNFEKLEERPIEYAKLSSKGQGVGAIVAMETQFHLTPDGDRTHMRWEADVRVAGPIGSMGQRVFQPIVNQQVTNVLNALEAQVAEAKAE